ncbi:MAG TPA: hypothetical protein VF794_28965 [Archangium sp.]|jgi:hypothetical protein|uniref:hypothetical protein n=1 Tax=Archangium sp. TaxID=1872627 RepID=UPI002EDA22E4
MKIALATHPRVLRGTRELRRLLREAVELRDLDVEGFRHWHTRQLASWQSDPVFAQRTRIRDLRRAHSRLHELERACRHATAADRASAQFARLHPLEEELSRTGKAISGLSAALARSAPEKQPGLRDKLAAFQVRQRALQEEQAELIRASPTRRELLRLQEELQQARTSLGLDREEAHLAELSRHQGQRSGHSGESFEELAVSQTWRYLVPELVGSQEAGARQRLRVLQGVTLRAARVELDQLVIRQPRRAEQPVEVLALVEVKRNLNDLAHGFRLRQENLAWVRGDAGHYEPEQYRTRYFRSGHFDREAVHEEDGERFVFTRDSFRYFRREPDVGPYLRRLCFITRAGSLTGVSTATLSRIRHRIATDERWQPQSEAYLRELLHWCQSLAEPLETPDVLRLYCSVPGRARQILVVAR